MAMPRLSPEAARARAALMKSQGAALQAARLRAGLNQPDAAKAWKVKLDTYRQWEHGRRSIPVRYRRRAVADWGADPAALAETCSHCGRPF